MASGYEKHPKYEPRVGNTGLVLVLAIVLLVGAAALGWMFV